MKLAMQFYNQRLNPKSPLMIRHFFFILTKESVVIFRHHYSNAVDAYDAVDDAARIFKRTVLFREPKIKMQAFIGSPVANAATSSRQI